MAKVHSSTAPPSPLEILHSGPSPCSASPSSSSSSSSSSCYISSEREVFTIWMKSLLLNGIGCTVFDSNGQIIYRVDNYDRKCSGKVYLMDLRGKVLIKILKKKLVLGRWEGYRWNNESKLDTHNNDNNRWFEVKREYCSIFRGDCSSCDFWSETGHLMRYKILVFPKKFSCKIVDNSSGLVVAQVARKVTKTGIALGKDVLSLVVEPNIDHSLIMGLVLVYGLMNHIL